MALVKRFPVLRLVKNTQSFFLEVTIQPDRQEQTLSTVCLVTSRYCRDLVTIIIGTLIRQSDLLTAGYLPGITKIKQEKRAHYRA